MRNNDPTASVVEAGEEVGGMRERESEIIEIELSDGATMLAEVEILDGDVALTDRMKLDEIGPAAAKLGTWAKDAALKAMPQWPDRFGVQIGVKLAVKGGVLTSIIADVSGEASLVVTMEWDVSREA